MEEYTIIRTAWVNCGPPVIVTQANGAQRVVQPARMCMEDYEDTVQRPRAIDPVAERNKLKGLQERQRALSKQAEPAVAQCRAALSAVISGPGPSPGRQGCDRHQPSRSARS